MQLWSVTSCSLIVIADFIQFVSGVFCFWFFFWVDSSPVTISELEEGEIMRLCFFT
jgi:hypothetical protein